MGKERISGEVAAALSIVWWLTYEYKNKMSNYANGRKLVMIRKCLNYLRSNITPPCSLLELTRKKTVTVTHVVGVF